MAAIDDFAEELRRLYGMTLEAGYAMRLAHKKANADLIPPTRLENTLWFGRGDPNDPRSTHHYSVKMRDLVAGFDTEGKHSQYLRKMAVVSAFAIWEGVARPAISKEANGAEIKHRVFGDLNKLRQAVIHVGDKLDRNLEVLTFFSRGERVTFNEEQFHQLFAALFGALDDISLTYFKRGLQAPLDRKLTPLTPFQDGQLSP